MVHRALKASLVLGIFVVLLSESSGCSSTQVPDGTLIGARILSVCPPPSSDNYFFQPPTFASDTYDGAASRKEISSLFTLMSEPSLSCGAAPDEGYRLLNYFPHWGPPHPVAIRLIRFGSRRGLVAVSLIGEQATALAKGDRIQKQLTNQDWMAFNAAVDRVGFWIVPNRPAKNNLAILDGDRWVIEGRRGGLYRTLPLSDFVSRPAIAELVKAFFTMAGMKIPEQLSHRY